MKSLVVRRMSVMKMESGVEIEHTEARIQTYYVYYIIIENQFIDWMFRQLNNINEHFHLNQFVFKNVPEIEVFVKKLLKEIKIFTNRIV